jgi:flotillin
VRKEEIQVSVVEKEGKILEQDKEIIRRTRELDATVNKPADAKKYAQQVEADAKRYTVTTEAQGRADAQKAEGFAAAEVVAATGRADAEAIRLRGQAEADVIRAKGLAEAESMMKKAESYSQYNAAAVTEMFFKVLPEIAREIASPLSKLDKITVISNGGTGPGGDQGTGASKITADVAAIIAQLPPVVESLSGVSLAGLMSRIPGLAGLETPASKATVPANAEPKK